MQRQTQLVIVLVLVVLVIGAAFWFSKTESTGSAAEATATTVEQTDVGGEASGETVREVLEVEAPEPAVVSIAEIRIQVVEASSRAPLAGATVHAFGDVEAHLGTSDDEGLIVVERSLLEGRDVLCRKEGYAPERVAAPRSRLGEEIVVELAPLVALEGRIVVARDDTLPLGLTVLAWPESEESPSGLTRTELLEHPFCTWTESGEEGAFTLQGRADTLYSIAVGGKGWASTSVGSARAGGPPTSILVHRAYAVALRFTEVGGAPLELSPAFGGRMYGTSEFPGGAQSLGKLHWRVPGTGLNAGMERVIELARREGWCRVAVFRDAFRYGKPILDTLEGGSIEIDWPGYQPKRVEFACTRLDIDAPIVTVELERTAVGFGALELAADELLADAIFGDAYSHLALTDVDTATEFYLVPRYAQRTDARVVWTGVPAGRYRAVYESSSFAPETRFPVISISGDEEITITSGVTTKAMIAAPDLGLVVLEPMLDGRPYSGRLTVDWLGPIDPMRSPTRSRMLAGPPYQLALPAAHYEFEARHPFPRPVQEERPRAAVELERNATSTAELLLRRRP